MLQRFVLSTVLTGEIPLSTEFIVQYCRNKKTLQNFHISSITSTFCDAINENYPHEDRLLYTVFSMRGVRETRLMSSC